VCDNPVTVLKEGLVRARVEHRCQECNLPIFVGTKYFRMFGVDYYKDPMQYKAHQRCYEMLVRYGKNEYGYFYYGTMMECVSREVLNRITDAVDHCSAVRRQGM